MSKSKVYIVDIDNTICSTVSNDYKNSIPLYDRICRINQLYHSGNTIVYYSARGTSSGIDWYELTHNQLESWGCKYHELRLGKLSYDVWIDDKALNASQITMLSTTARL